MICDRCKKRKASVHLTEIIKNVKSELHICEECAREIGLDSKLTTFSLSVPDVVSFMKSEVKELNELICPTCGTSESDLVKSGRVGCPDCYTYLEDSIKVLLDREQIVHKGKKPLNVSETVSVRESIEIDDSLDDLHKKLDLAVSEERYEEAAVLRDRIKERERI